jgi:hypothetical protein
LKQAGNQLVTGLGYALVSLVLVVGSLMLVLAEQNPASGSTQTATPYPASSPSPAPSEAPATEMPPTQQPPSEIPPTAAVMGTVTPTSFFPTVRVATQPTFAATASCGPYAGWIRGYVVQPGDTLFRIATIYGTTVARLALANCKSGSVIHPGERLWVPFAPTITPGITLIPTFDTPTQMETATPETPTAASQPTETITQDP